MSNNSDWRDVFCGRKDELQFLKDKWQLIANSESPEPQCIALIAESGLGKTRLVQEFYSWLVHEVDSEGYWPKKLGSAGENLLVNPVFSATDKRPVMPFLWWGIRFKKSQDRNQVFGSALPGHLSDLVPHFYDLHAARERSTTILKAGGLLINLAALGSIQLVQSVSELGNLGFSAAVLARDKFLSKIKTEEKESVKNIQSSHLKDQVEILHQDFQTMMTPPMDRKVAFQDALEFVKGKADLENIMATMCAVPTVIFLDDAQWIDEDALLLISKLMQDAKSNNWPLMIIATHWETEWYKDKNKKTGIPNLISQNWKEDHSENCLTLELIPALELIIEKALPGLSEKQVEQFLEKAGGNPLLLTEILRCYLAKPESFVDKNTLNPLTSLAENKFKLKFFKLHEVIGDRFDKLQSNIREVLALISSVGSRVPLHLLEKICYQRGIAFSEEIGNVINTGSFLNINEDQIAEFSQRAYFDVIREYAPDFGFSQAVIETNIIQQAEFFLDESGHKASPVAEELIYTIFLGCFNSQEGEKVETKLRLLSRMTNLLLSQWRYKEASRFAKKFHTTLKEKVQKQDGKFLISTNSLSSLIKALLVSNPLAAKSVFQLCDTRDKNTYNNFILLSRMSEIERRIGNYDNAIKMLSEAIDLIEKTPKHSKLLISAYINKADLLDALNDSDSAYDTIQKAVCVQKKSCASNSVVDLTLRSLLLGKRSGFAKKRGNFSEAMKYLEEALCIDEKLIKGADCSPQIINSAAVTCTKRSDLAKKINNLVLARTSILKAKGYYSEVEKQYGRGSSNARGKAITHKKLAEILLHDGEKVEAEQILTESIEGLESVALTQDVSSLEIAIESYQMLAKINLESDLKKAISYISEAIKYIVISLRENLNLRTNLFQIFASVDVDARLICLLLNEKKQSNKYFEKEVFDLERALKINGGLLINKALAHMEMGKLHELSGDDEKAERQFLKAKEIANQAFDAQESSQNLVVDYKRVFDGYNYFLCNQGRIEDAYMNLEIASKKLNLEKKKSGLSTNLARVLFDIEDSMAFYLCKLEWVEGERRHWESKLEYSSHISGKRRHWESALEYSSHLSADDMPIEKIIKIERDLCYFAYHGRDLDMFTRHVEGLKRKSPESISSLLEYISGKSEGSVKQCEFYQGLAK